MYAALLLDDEELAQKTLKGLIASHCPEISILHEARDTEEAIKILAKQRVDFLFLDIELGSESGFDALDRIQTQNQAVIFVTAHEAFSLRALKVGAVDYLLKPISIDELKAAVKKGIGILPKPSEPVVSDQRIMVTKGGGFDLLDSQEIVFAEAEGNYTTFYLHNGQKITSSRQIGFYEELLLPPRFFRSHKSYIIHLKYLKGYSSKEGHMALLEKAQQVPVSRRKLQEFLSLCKHLPA